MATVAVNSTHELTKRVYGDHQRLEFDHGIIGDDAPWTEREKLGDAFYWSVVLQGEHGATYNGTSGAEATLNDPIVGVSKQASVSAYEFVMRTRIGLRIMEDAVGKGDKAFEDATSMQLENLMESAELRKEHSLLYGQQGIFKVSSIDTGVITVTDATWCAAMADYLEGAILEAFDGQGASASQHDTNLTVSAVDLDAKTITVTGTSSSVVANDWLTFKGARTTTAWNEMVGLYKLMTTTTGTVQGINIGTYSRMRPNVYSSVGRPNMYKVLKGVTKLVARRIRKIRSKLLVPSYAYELLNSDLMGGRRFDGSYNRTKGKSGVENIEFIGQTGVTTIEVHPLLRDGDALLYGEKNLFRTGSADLKWDTGPNGESDLWDRLADKTSYEARCHMIQAIGLLRPSNVVSYQGLSET